MLLLYKICYDGTLRIRKNKSVVVTVRLSLETMRSVEVLLTLIILILVSLVNFFLSES